MKDAILAVETDATLRRAALLRDGVLEAIEVDRLDENIPLPGALYRCRITGLMPGIGAATADLGEGLTGFFPDAAGLVAGQSLLAEIRREPDLEKLARLSPAVQLRSAHLVFTPARPGINISRKIVDAEERQRLHTAIEPFACHGGFVIRTDAYEIESETLRNEAEVLITRYNDLSASTAPGLRAPAPDAVARIMARAERIDAIVTNEPQLASLPKGPALDSDPAPFETLDLDATLHALLGPRHDLMEGWLSIDTTPALVSVDVNTANATGANARLRVNLDAARTIPRLISLKKLGGLIFVDFAGAPKGKDRYRILDAFRCASAHYLEGSTTFGWGPAGLLEAVCRRPGRPLALILTENAP